MRGLSFLFFFFCFSVLHAQIIDNRYGTAFSEENFFNSDFIRNNKIKIIRGQVSTKRDNEGIIERDQFVHYEFDAKGRLTVMMSTFASYATNKDTTIMYFVYDGRGNLITKRHNDNFGFYSYNYEYDSLNRVVRETYCREENLGPDRYHFALGKQFVISSETYAYHQYVKDQKVKKFYNNYDKLYQETFSYFNDLGYLSEQITRLTLSGKETKIAFEYNEHGLVSKKSDISYIFGYNAIINTFTYDKHGNMEEMTTFHNDKKTTLRSIVYDRVTMLMSAQVMKDFETGLIYILKYSYQYH